MAQFFEPDKCAECGKPLGEWAITGDENKRPIVLRRKPLPPKVNRDFLVHLECWEKYAAKNLSFEGDPANGN